MLSSRAMALVAITTAVGLAACSLPDNIHRQGQQLANEVKQVQEATKASLNKYRQEAKASGYLILAPFAKKEGWEASLQKSVAMANAAAGRYDKEVKTLLEKNDKDDAAKVQRLFGEVSNDLAAAQALSQQTLTRRDRLYQVSQHASKFMTDARGWAKTSGKANASLDAYLKPYRQRWPNREKDIAKRQNVIKHLDMLIQSALAGMEKQFAKHERSADGSGAEASDGSTVADYALIADNHAKIKSKLGQQSAADKELRKQAASLDRSYTKTLNDSKVACYVAIGRSSWDSGDDYDNSPDKQYPLTEIPCDTADYLAKLPETQTLATYGSGWGGWKLRLNIDEGVWNQLRIDPKADWPSRHGDDESEFWIADWANKFYHKYTIVEDGKKTETGWVEVDGETNEEYEDAIGMDIAVKSYGMFEDETLTDPAPPGLALVGNEKYGRWEDDGRGGRRWSFLEMYAMYHLFLGPGHYYGYGEYSRWNRDYRGRREYYGTGASGRGRRYGTYGSSTRQSSRMTRSSFARRGGFRNAGSASIRGAGRSYRGGGPGGGGK